MAMSELSESPQNRETRLPPVCLRLPIIMPAIIRALVPVVSGQKLRHEGRHDTNEMQCM